MHRVSQEQNSRRQGVHFTTVHYERTMILHYTMMRMLDLKALTAAFCIINTQNKHDTMYSNAY